MIRALLAILLCVASLDAYVCADRIATAKRVQATSVQLLCSDNMTGAGTLFVRNGETYVLTCDHVVMTSRKESSFSAGGFKIKSIALEEVTVIQQLRGSDEKVTAKAFIVAYSPQLTGHDLALLKVKNSPFGNPGTSVSDDEQPLEVGTDLIHVGCPSGSIGRQSVSRGMVSYTDRIEPVLVSKSPPDTPPEKMEFDETNPRSFEQADYAAMPGSSGGGVFNELGELVGVEARQSNENHNLYIPLRRVREWCRAEKLEWLLENPKPTLAEP